MSAGGCPSGSKKSAISFMNPLSAAEDSEQMKQIMSENLDQLIMIEEPAKCTFADRIFEHKNSVDCKFTGKMNVMPAGSLPLNGSPMYPQLMIGNMSQPQYGYPLEYYSDNNESRNIYYGIYSLIG
jgi:hypothetical protein